MAATGHHSLGSSGGIQYLAATGINLNLANRTHRIEMNAGDEGLKAPDGPLRDLHQRAIHHADSIPYVRGQPDVGLTRRLPLIQHGRRVTRTWLPFGKLNGRSSSTFPFRTVPIWIVAMTVSPVSLPNPCHYYN